MRGLPRPQPVRARAKDAARRRVRDQRSPLHRVSLATRERGEVQEDGGVQRDRAGEERVPGVPAGFRLRDTRRRAGRRAGTRGRERAAVELGEPGFRGE